MDLLAKHKQVRPEPSLIEDGYSETFGEPISSGRRTLIDPIAGTSGLLNRLGVAGDDNPWCRTYFAL